MINIKDVIYSILGMLLSRGVVLLITILAARLIGVEEFGKFGLIQSSIYMLGLLIGNEIGLTSIKLVGQYGKQNTSNFWKVVKYSNLFILAMLILILLLVVFNSSLISENILGTERYQETIIIAVVLLCLNSIDGNLNGILSGLGKFDFIFRSNIIRGIASLSVSFYFISEFALTGVFLSLLVGTIGSVFSNIYAIFSLNIEDKDKDKIFDKRIYLKFFIKFTTPAILASSLTIPAIWFSQLIISKNNNGFVELGVFSSVNQINIVLVMLASSAALPLLSKLVDSTIKNDEKINSLNMNINIWVGIFPLLFVITYPGVIASIFKLNLAPDLLRDIVYIVGFYTFIILYKQGLARLLVVHNKMYFSTISNGLWGIGLVIFTYFFRHNGAYGLVLAMLVSYLLNTIIIIPFYLKRKIIKLNQLFNFNVVLSVFVILLQTFVVYIYDSFLIRTFSFVLLSFIFILDIKRFLKKGKEK